MLAQKVAASDFDGTLFREQQVTGEDIKAITHWREAGNKFAIVTGRAYIMMVPHLREFHIPCDFLVCNNGSLLCEPDGRALWQGELPKAAIAELLCDPAVQSSQQYVFSAGNSLYAAHIGKDSIIKVLSKQWDMPVNWIDEAEVAEMPPAHQLVLSFTEHEEARAAATHINQRYGHIVRAYANYMSVDITPPGTDKSSGIKRMLELKGWQGAEVHTIGDGDNDLPMLQAFRGATVATARAEIKAQVSCVYSSVGQMLDELRDEKKQ